MVFDNASAYNNYDYNRSVGYAEIKAKKGTVSAAFPDLTNGSFVVSIFHDEDNNQDLNLQNGLPIEGYGTSGIEDPYHTPSFSEALVPADTTTINIHYLQ